MSPGFNYTPWIILAVIVLVSAYLKGYRPGNVLAALRGNPQSSPAFEPAGKPQAINTAAPAVASETYGEASPSEAHLLDRLDSHTLGVYFAKAKRRETEANLAHEIARTAGDAIEATFKAPFSPASAASPAGSPPAAEATSPA